MVKQYIEYQGNLRTQAKHEPSQATIITDAPVDNHGKGESFSPTDLLCTSLSSCMMTLMGIKANALNIELGKIDCHLEKTMSKDAPRRICQIDLAFRIHDDIDETNREKLEHAAWTCPVKQSIHPDIIINATFDWPNSN